MSAGKEPVVPAPGEERVLSVSQLTAVVKGLLEGSALLRDVLVRGEVSNFKEHPSGHLYFTLRDRAAAVRCVMFRGWRDGLRLVRNGDGTLLRDGEVVVAQGYVGVYERDGQYQLYVQRLWRDEALRLGEMYRALEELRRRLEAEGLFDPARKRRLPLLPRRVAIVTSPSGAALRDMLRIMGRRLPGLAVTVVPAVVQGEEAPRSIARAIELVNRHLDADVLVVGRGGGSAEDLWAFNSEEVVRAVAGSRVPVVTAVGHETDVTLADLAADLRAPTPSAAAEMVVPERQVLLRRVADLAARLAGAARRSVERRRERLRRFAESPVLTRPLLLVDRRRQRVDELWARTVLLARHRVAQARARLAPLAARLAALDPAAVLRRGYSICLREDGGMARAGAVRPGDGVAVLVRDGRLACRVDGATKDDDPLGVSRGGGDRGEF